MEGWLKQFVYAFMVLLLLLHIYISPSLSLEYNNSDGTYGRCIESERQALLAFKKGFSGHGGDEELLSSWGGREAQKQDCCRWRGVYCDKGTSHVTRLHLGDQYLRGTISSKLSELKHLEFLHLQFINESQVPKFIGSLTNLRYLHLDPLDDGKFPYQLGNLTHLQYLSLTGNYYWGVELENNLNWLPYLSSLKYLDLSFNYLGNVFDWLEIVNKLPNLRNLTLQQCDLPPPIFSTLSHINSSKSLASVELRNNPNAAATTSMFKWLGNYNTSLVYLSLESTNLNGSLPDVFGNMRSLVYLNLWGNNLEGGIPHSFANLSSLRWLSLSYNNLSGQYSDFLQILSNCAPNSLKYLDFSRNHHISGSLPNLINFSSLKYLSLSSTGLSGRVPECIGQMSKLEGIEMANTSLEGTISETHFSQLSRLLVLDLSYNSLAFNFSADWVPPFHLERMVLSGCTMGPSLPRWLQWQKKLLNIYMFNARISDILPSWFWDWSHKATQIDLSCNQIRGTLENMSFEFVFNPGLNLSWNLLEGPIHSSVLSNASYVDLSNNKFSGPASFLCAAKVSDLTYLDLSSNNLSGELPNCWTHFKSLIFLDLSNNSFSGKVPATMGKLISIESLKLDNNKFVGEFPSLKNCRNLKAFDLEDNKFSGPIPMWVGVLFPNLAILILRSNLFNGSMPSQLCNLTSIRILDFSINNIFGSIPKCLNNLTTLAREGNPEDLTISHFYTTTFGPFPYFHGVEIEYTTSPFGDIYEDEITISWKGTLSRYKSTLGLVKSVDLSSNKLTGEIPSDIIHLVGLVSLNLSSNHLTGQINREMGKLQSLQSLDLSRNLLHGTIPTSVFQI
ncbi:putative non-specific serine/threonine protein kinase [Rosa chinensis]|uniref:Putative non-specific serine/threonine protein kinase n=1 Tax=Rosa chinensis TaxID=74649 RepID=A0A2P6SHJ2_ROSCH|nr:receptor-like protein EIX2 [Rosa chinensis]XP_024174731.1 receptor-like protein EIX2 [Rosa chinensis]PRQ58128.1 putative non-specific serine/threonine protein kinase [Rosa chinensis]